ncbi:hypothetical protein KP509_08G025100 [Ceratopteris richardii]|uniref:RING-type E3 ubiquitin transferase n=1 Tax=Ceratopteris richardii TaxID=49495 RepID=A0A8T2U919_CERRI|nr:hypothetical protein KP509_08G025100 [Ceratopteris richardii]
MDHSSILHWSRVPWRKRNPVSDVFSPQHPPDPLVRPLLNGLITSCREFNHWKKSGVCQKRNVATACCRAACLLPLFEDVLDSGASIPPSALPRFRRLRSIFLNLKALLHNCRHRSKLLLLMEQGILASQFHDIASSIADSLAFFQFELLDISEDTREYIKLVQVQCSADAAPFIDPSERVLQVQVLAIVSAMEEGVSPDKENLKHIFEVLCFNGWEDCERELWLLEKEREKMKSEQDYRQIRAVISLIGLVRYVRCLMYELEMGIQVTSTCMRYELPCPSMSEVVLMSYKQTEEGGALVPDDFKCPISLEIMVDPVASSTGQTYDRASITRWLEEGHTTCPKTSLDLLHYNLTPNFTLRRIITQWCADNDYVLDSDAARKVASAGTSDVSVRANTKAALEFTKLTAKVLVAKLSSGSIAAQRRAAYELRVMAKDGEETCSCLASAGAIRALTTVLESPDIMTQENAVTAMHNLSINDENKNIIMATEGALDGIVRVLTMKTSSIVARANAAAALFSISTVKAYRTTIASREPAIEGLMQLSCEGNPTAKKDAAITLLSLALVDTISAQLLEKGIVLSVIETLQIETQMGKGWTEELLALLTLLLRTPDGLAAVRVGSCRIAWIFVKMIAEGSGWLQEYAVTLLLAMCSDQVEAERSAAFHREQLRRNPAFLADLQRLLDAGNPRTQLKAFRLLKLLNTSIHSSPSLKSITRK